jgi:hypothetical protein
MGKGNLGGREEGGREGRVTGDVARRRPDALEVPDGLARPGEVVREEAAAVVPVEDAREPPLVARQRAQVQNLHHQQVARHRRPALRVRHADRPAQVVHLHPNPVS